MRFPQVRLMVRGIVVASLLAVAPGCVLRVTARPAYVVDVDPPPPRAEPRPAPRAGYVWVSGRWEYQGNNWVWKSGHWQRSRQNYVWVDGHWDRRGNRYHWVEGRWEAGGGGGGGGVVVRDHSHAG